jgi:hypothetical protein
MRHGASERALVYVGNDTPADPTLKKKPKRQIGMIGAHVCHKGIFTDKIGGGGKSFG